MHYIQTFQKHIIILLYHYYIDIKLLIILSYINIFQYLIKKLKYFNKNNL